MKHLHQNLFVVLLLAVILLVGCNTVKGLFSKGQDELKLASQAWDAGDQLNSLVHATNSLILDPEFYQGKTFIYERFNQVIENTNTRLVKLQNPTTSKEVEEKYATYVTLIAIYDNLKQIKLPLKHPKGKWSWTTELKDYSSEKENARSEALKILMEDGNNFVNSKDVKNAEDVFKKAISKYTIDANQKNTYINTIVSILCKKGLELTETTNIEEAISGNNFYNSAKQFANDSPIVLDGIKKSNAHISDLYLKQGIALEKTGHIEKMIEAIENYKNAQKWNKNQTAIDAQKVVTEKISEYYYNLAITAEKNKDTAGAIANFENTRKWIPNYKDAMSRMYHLRIGGKIEALAKNLNTTNLTFGKFQTRVNTVSGYTDKSNEVMEKITYVSDKAREANTYMKSTSSTLKTFSIIPVVGTTTNILGKSIDVAQDPIGGLVTKLDAIEKPVITPTKEIVGKAKAIVDNIKEKMATTSSTLKTSSDYSIRLKDCIATVTEETKFKEAEAAIEEINKGLLKTNETMVTMDNSLVKIENESKKVADMASNINTVTNGFKSLGKAVDKVKPVVDELNGVLDKKFGFSSYKYSAREILNGVGGVMKWVMDKLSDLVMAALKPVLKKFNIDIPSVPGIDKFKTQLDNLKSTYDIFGSEVNAMKEKLNEYTSAQQQIQNNLTKLEKAVGCEIAPAPSK